MWRCICRLTSRRSCVNDTVVRTTQQSAWRNLCHSRSANFGLGGLAADLACARVVRWLLSPDAETMSSQNFLLLLSLSLSITACGGAERSNATPDGGSNACASTPAEGPATTTNLPRAPQVHRPESTVCDGKVGPCPAVDGASYGCDTCVTSASGTTCFTTKTDAGYALGHGCLNDADCDPILAGGVCSCDGTTQQGREPSTNACVFGNCPIAPPQAARLPGASTSRRSAIGLAPTVSATAERRDRGPCVPRGRLSSRAASAGAR